RRIHPEAQQRDCLLSDLHQTTHGLVGTRRIFIGQIRPESVQLLGREAWGGRGRLPKTVPEQDGGIGMPRTELPAPWRPGNTMDDPRESLKNESLLARGHLPQL